MSASEIRAARREDTRAARRELRLAHEQQRREAGGRAGFWGRLGGTRGLLQNSVFAVLLGTALTVYTTVGLMSDTPRLVVILPVALVVAGALAFVALNDVETFVLIALAIRSSMDALKLGSPGVADPGALLGMFVLGLGVVWLMNRRAALKDDFPTSGLSTAMIVFSATALLGVLTSASPLVSVIEWSRMANIVVLYLVVEQLAARSRATVDVLAAICCAVPIPAAVALSQLASGQDLFEAGGFSRITGTFTHSNPLAYFCAFISITLIAVLPFLKGRRRAAVGVVLALTLPMLILTYTRSAWLAVFAGVAVIALRHNRKMLLALGALVLALAFLVPSVGERFADLETEQQASGAPANSLVWRVQYWGEALDLAKDSPITGVGLKAVASTTEEGKQPHNDFVRAFVELGIPGLLAYVWMMISIVRTAIASVRATDGERSLERGVALASLGVATGLVVLSGVANLMSQVVVMWYAVAVLALASGNTLRRSRLDAVAADLAKAAPPSTDTAATDTAATDTAAATSARKA